MQSLSSGIASINFVMPPRGEILVFLSKLNNKFQYNSELQKFLNKKRSIIYFPFYIGSYWDFLFFKFVGIWLEIYFWKVQFSGRVIIMTNASITGNFLSAFGVSTRSRKRRWRKLKEKTNSSIKTNNTHKQTIYFKKRKQFDKPTNPAKHKNLVVLLQK